MASDACRIDPPEGFEHHGWTCVYSAHRLACYGPDCSLVPIFIPKPEQRAGHWVKWHELTEDEKRPA